MQGVVKQPAKQYSISSGKEDIWIKMQGVLHLLSEPTFT